ncbi:MAG: hypothetical protein OHK0029_25090 [Armatimonadaceae bacterium]
MNPLTLEWIDKAEGDFATSEREVVVTDKPNYDAVCFHCQQCAEKYLKAVLQEAGIPFPRTHDLSVLLTLILPLKPQWQFLQPLLNLLTDYAVQYRYPGESADLQEAQDAKTACDQVRTTVRNDFGLPV